MQRKTAAQTSGGAAAKDDDDEAHGQRPLDDDKDNDDDGKNTRLTLMEEVLLLGLKDREVVVNFIYFKILCRDASESHKTQDSIFWMLVNEFLEFQDSQSPPVLNAFKRV